MDYQKHYSTRITPQSEPVPDSGQVKNSAGGYAWAVDDWARLDRFLILGTEGGSYYASERALTVENAQATLNCIKADGPRVVARIVEISTEGRAAKNDPALFALAMCAGLGDDFTRPAAMEALPRVARIGTYLFNFLNYVQAFRGWGRALRDGVAAWYLDKDIERLAYQVIKYRQRNGWAHRDVLRQAHPNASGVYDDLFHWLTQGETRESLMELPVVRGYLAAQTAESAGEVATLVKEYKLPREAVPTDYLGEAVVWDALLDDMPVTALIRNLGNMGKVGLLVPGNWSAIERITAALADDESLRRGRVHPIQMLAALLTYGQGHGQRGGGEWLPVPQVVDALDAAFYKTFRLIEPTGQRWMLGLDVSGSMGLHNIAGVPGLTPRIGAAVMAMVTARTENRYAFVGFSHELVPLNISREMRLNDVIAYTSSLPFGGTDAALPMLYAIQHNIEVDVFAIYTDSETWAGRIHPTQALRAYRDKIGINAKLAVVGMVSNGFSLADPRDPGMMDFVGFDTGTPQALSAFATLGGEA